MSLDHLFKNTIFLLGAGASMDANCLSSNEMLKKLKEEIDDLEKPDSEGNIKFYSHLSREFKEIYNFILASLHYQLTLKDPSARNSTYLNIEDFVMVLRQLMDKEFIIPYPLVGNWNDKIIKWEIKVNKGNVFEEFKKFIVQELINKWISFVPEKAEEVLKPIRNLMNSSDPFMINIFSMNYDLVFEKTFNSDTERLLEDGFSTKWIDNEVLKIWTDDVFENPHSGTKINLFKLHGSLNWEYNQETEEIIIKEELFDGKEPLIIFGSNYKMLSFDPFLFILSEFRKKLQAAKLFVVIGYSFHDKYINNLIIQQLSRSPESKLLVVDPYKDSSSEKFSEELKNIQETKSINDVINFKQTNPEKIQIINLTMENFLKEYFSNNAANLSNILDEIEKGDKVF